MLFLTRNCDPRFFGFDLADALTVFENACRWAATNGFTMFVKHHPRDLHIAEWRHVQKKYPCVEEISMSLNDVKPSFKMVLTFYTSAGLLFCARGIPVFDVTPYKGTTGHLPFHYINACGEISHDLVEYGFYKQCQVSELPTDGEVLSSLGALQKKRVDECFPKSTNKRIYEACEQLFVEGLNA